jgi:polysaccharide export outer membrane protein
MSWHRLRPRPTAVDTGFVWSKKMTGRLRSTSLRRRSRAFGAWAVVAAVLGVFLSACSSGVPADSGSASKMYPRQELGDFARETGEPATNREEYRIGVGDVLDIIFVYHQNLNTRDVPVRHDGRISVPYVGDAMAAGLTPMELDSVLTSHFAEILRDPSLSVIVKEEAERLVYVLGEVDRPGGYPYKDRITLVQAIAAAGGSKDGAKLAHTVLIRREGQDKIVGVEVDVKSIINGEAIQNDLLLRKYDIVYVPKSAIYTVAEFAKQVNSIMDIVLTGWQIRTLEANYEYFTSRRTSVIE